MRRHPIPHVAMSNVCLYVLAALPATLCLFAWRGAAWAVAQLNFVVGGNEIAGCAVLGVVVTGLLGIGLVWGGVFIVPAALLSVILVAAVPSVQRRATNSTIERDARKSSTRPLL